MAHLVYFSESKIELAREAAKHPPLVKILSHCDANDFEDQLAEIAAYCEVLVDGAYMPMEIDKLCGILTNKLRAKRIGIALPPSGWRIQ